MYNRLAQILGRRGSQGGGSRPGINYQTKPNFGGPPTMQGPISSNPTPTPTPDPNVIPGAYVPPMQHAPTYGSPGANAYYGGRGGGFGIQKTASEAPPIAPNPQAPTPKKGKDPNIDPNTGSPWLNSGGSWDPRIYGPNYRPLGPG